ncbi:unnamed protein product, partial [Porites evermanni]
LDECTTGSHSCDVNSVCQNTVGSYTCPCNVGYTGDGKPCNDIDECSTNSHSCDANAVCNNTVGSYACACKAGYTGDGRTCTGKFRTCGSWITAVSNCSTMSSNLVTVHNQDENVYIQHRHNGERSWIGLNDRSVEGSFVWTNKEINLDECTTGSHSCDVNSVCQNTVGSYTCSCNAGYTGDGKPCNDIDECSTNSHSCDANAVCNNTVGSYACACKAGYTGDGRTCTDIDECSTNTHSCDVNAACNNTVGSYACACKVGYSGDGRTCTGEPF